MSLILSGTDGLSDVDGSAATPAIRGTDANTGIFFPAADTIAFAEGGAEIARFDSSGNLGIGTSSPRAKLSVTNGTENTSGDAPQEAIITGANQAITTGNGILTIQSNTAIAADVGATIALGGRIRNTGTTTDASNYVVLKGAKENATSDNSAGYFAVATKPNGLAPVERMRIDSSGNVFVGGTTQNTSTKPVYASTTAKAWVSFGGAGAINGSFNVSSVTRASTGNFIVNFTSALANANFAATANSWQSASNAGVAFNLIAFTTSTYQISCFENNTPTNPNAVYSVVFAT